VLAQEAAVLLLADRDQDHVAVDDELGAGDRLRPAAALLVRRAELVLDQLEPGHLARLADDLDGRDHVHDLDALHLGLLELELVDRNLLDRAAVGHHRLLGAHPQHVRTQSIEVKPPPTVTQRLPTQTPSREDHISRN
jgi:hypothetical protein